jgi:hypothetical protein
MKLATKDTPCSKADAALHCDCRFLQSVGIKVSVNVSISFLVSICR